MFQPDLPIFQQAVFQTLAVGRVHEVSYTPNDWNSYLTVIVLFGIAGYLEHDHVLGVKHGV
jgi:hypothetical protein